MQMMAGNFVILIRLQQSQVKRKTLGWPKCMSREHPFMLRSPPHGMSFQSQFCVKGQMNQNLDIFSFESNVFIKYKRNIF